MNDSTNTLLPSGALLGPYKIQQQIGVGGMGSVHRAIDTRLGRMVAIKIASERYNERFELEARAISKLNHPHVCTLYDVGPNYLVMELIEGSTLAAELTKGPLVPEMASRYGAQIAGALAEAHSLGILHRDLKPSNIMLTRHGIKVLDFGLAKLLPEAKIDPEANLTQTGAIMGTPSYMAPEQFESREPSSATDLFALGLVLYEMTVGRLPLPGASLGQVLSSGSHAFVSPSRECAGVSPGLAALITRLLEKDPRKRPQMAGEVAAELSAIAAKLAPVPARTRWRTVIVTTTALLLLSLLAWFYLESKHRESQLVRSRDPSSFTQLTSFTDAAVNPVLSPDGRMLAFYRSDNPFRTAGEIWAKLLPNGEPIQVTHDPHMKYNIAFSPDGTRIAYTAFRKFFDSYTVSALGGDSEPFLPNSAGLSWLDDEHLLFSQINTGVHMEIVTSKTDRSDLREIYSPAQARGMAHYSYLSPDKKWVLLAEMDPEWHPCRVAPFSGGSAGTQVGPAGACTSAAWSPDGQWVYLGVQVSGRQHLWRQRFPDGRPEQITFGSTDEDGIAMAPDGRSLITSIFTRQNAVWVHESKSDRAISTEGYAGSAPPLFSKDGKRLYYLLRRDSPESPNELWRADLVTGKASAILPGISIQRFDISPDETEVTYSFQPAKGPSQLWIAPLDRGEPPRRIAAHGEREPHFSANGEILFRQTDGNMYYWA